MENILLLSIGILSFALVYILLYAKKSDKIVIDARLDRLIVKSKEENLRDLQDTKKQKNKNSKGLNFASDKIRKDLISAGILMKPEEFLLIWLALGTLPMLILYIFTNNMAMALVASLIGIITPPIIIERAKASRIELFSKQLGESISVMGNSLRSGFTFQQSMQNIHENMPDPLAYEFGKTIREINYGMPFEEAILRLGDRMKNKDLDLLISAVIIQSRVGGNLAELIDIIGETIKDRIKIKRDIKTMTGAGKMSGIILGLLPVVLALVLTVLNPGYLEGFFTTTLGMMMLVLAVVMETIGFIVIIKMTDIKF